MSNINIWQFLAGTSLFIFAMNLMEEAIKKLAGRPFKKFLQKHTDSFAKSILTGTVITALLQSSSLVIVMVLSFVGAGIMKLSCAFAVTVGANLGTTLTSWIVAILGFKLNLESFAMPLLAIAFLIHIFFNSNHWLKNTASFITGFALLFLGLEWLKVSMIGMVQKFDFHLIQNWSAYWFVLVGVLVTSLIQSSSATVAITLAALSQGILTFDKSAAIVIGSELGTSLKFLLGAFNGSADKKRLALGNTLFNLAILVVSMLLLYPILRFIQFSLHIQDPLIGLASFQTGINLMGTILVLPFIKRISGWLESRYATEEIDSALHYPNHSNNDETLFLKAARKELNRILFSVMEFNKSVLEIPSLKQTPTSGLKKFFLSNDLMALRADQYKSIKSMQGHWWEDMLDFQSGTRESHSLHEVNTLLEKSQYLMHSAKNMKDISHNLDELKTSGNDYLFHFYNEIKSRYNPIYDRLLTQFYNPTDIYNKEYWELLKIEEGKIHEELKHKVSQLLIEDKISQLDAPSIMNVLREIYNAHIALINSYLIY